MRLRTLHSNMAIFTAPSILFFALTGAFQLFDLHESHGSYRAPVLIERLGRLHKDQVFAREDRHPNADPDKPVGGTPGIAGTAARAAAAVDAGDPVSASVLKWFFLLVTLVLASTTGLGLWLGLRRSPRRSLSWFLLLSGLVLPVVIVVL